MCIAYTPIFSQLYQAYINFVNRPNIVNEEILYFSFWWRYITQHVYLIFWSSRPFRMHESYLYISLFFTDFYNYPNIAITIRGYNPGIQVFFYSGIESRDNFLNPVSRVGIPGSRNFIVKSMTNF